MPELPEVETIRRDVCELLVGSRIEGVRVLGRRSVRRHRDPGDLVATLEGRTIGGARRLGKYLLVDLDDDVVLVVHLRMSGQLRLAATGTLPVGPHTHVVLDLGPGGRLDFVDPRTFGELVASRRDALDDTVPELGRLGRDALDATAPGSSPSWLVEMLARRRAPLKAVLTDQRRIAGIGNIYADEILHRAGLRPQRPAGELAAHEVRALEDAMTSVLAAAVADRGSSLADGQYRDLRGELGRYQQRHQVYGREGRACRRCEATIRRAKLGGRSTYSCPRCQR